MKASFEILPGIRIPYVVEKINDNRHLEISFFDGKCWASTTIENTGVITSELVQTTVLNWIANNPLN